jgi:hypothetical protein
MARFRQYAVAFVVALLSASVLLRGQQWKTQAPVLPTQNQQPSAPATVTSPAQPTSKQFDVSASSGWTDTGIEVEPGDKVTVTTAGALTLLGATVTPEGLTRSWKDVVRSLPVNSAGSGALIARIGDDTSVVPFLIGTKKEFVVSQPGRLFLGVNAGTNDQFNGAYKTTVVRTRPDKAVTAQLPEFKFDNALFDEIPRRVTDQAGGKGDMVNFLLIGPVASVQEAFASGGWVKVDKTKQDAALHAVLSTLQKQTYLEMPMSELYLFGRPQDFGFARAEPVAVVQQRHHLRIWKASFQFNGQEVWVGAATHDVGFEKDQRNNSVTHKIDPNVDEERDFVRASLTQGGGVIADTYVLPKDPIQEANTATGGTFHSDGRVLVMQLRAETPAAAGGH